jgi:hypothetical protein
MSQRLDDDLMDDLTEPEGPANTRHPFDDAGDFLDDLGDEPLGFDDAGDEFEAMDDMDDAVADILQADDADAFWGGLRKILHKVAPIVSKVAPLLPIPGAGLIGKAADIVGKVAADDGDELDALDGVADIADDADSLDAVAPVVAGLAIRKAVPAVARLPHHERKRLVKATATAAKHIARHHGPAGVLAMPAIVHHARRVVARHGAPVSQLAHTVRRTAAKVANSPRLVRRFAHASQRMRTVPALGGGALGTTRRWHRRYGGHEGYGYAPHHGTWGGTRSLSLHGPVRITIESM